MIQGKINSIIGQIGNMAHLGKTIANEKKALDNEKKALDNKKSIDNVEKKVKETEKLLFGEPSDTNFPVLTPEEERERAEEDADWHAHRMEYDKEYLSDLIKEYDEEMGYKADLATATDLKARIARRDKIRKPSTVKAPGGKNNGN